MPLAGTPILYKIRHRVSVSGCAATPFSLDLNMPEISRFLGIVIAMFYREHTPPHFHAKYGNYDITVEIETGVVNGSFPPRALGHVLEWHRIHKDGLREDWELAKARQSLKSIPPLE
jgi:hypothetical protein